MKKRAGIFLFLCVTTFVFLGLSVNNANALMLDEYNTPIAITQGIYDDYANDNHLKPVATSNVQGEIKKGTNKSIR